MNIPKPIVNTDSAHSLYSPSGSKRWIECPASISMESSIEIEEKSNFYAEEGTAAHELAAYCLEQELKVDSQYGNSFNGFSADNDMIRQVKKYTDYVESRLTWNNKLWVESQVNLDFLVHGMFGTADAIIVDYDQVEIIDLKYGRGVVVEVERNTQLMIYALGVLAHLAKHGIKFDSDFMVRITIAQPRAPHVDGPIRSWDVSVGDLRKFKNEVMFAIEESKSETPSFSPGEEQCRWCRAAPICKAYADYNLEIARIEFSDFAKSPREFRETLVDANTISQEQLVKILKHSKAIEQWLKTITDYATTLLQAGKPVMGYKLVYGRSIRAWEDQEKVRDLLIEAEIEEARLYNSKLRSPAQMEKELTDEEWKIVEDLVFKPTGKIVLAPETDGRLAVSPNSAAKQDWANEEF